MNREEEIYIEADKRYPRRWSGDAENSNNLDVFIEGAEWADEHPSRDMIIKVLSAIKHCSHFTDEQKNMVDYLPYGYMMDETIDEIIEHWND